MYVSSRQTYLSDNNVLSLVEFKTGLNFIFKIRLYKIKKHLNLFVIMTSKMQSGNFLSDVDVSLTPKTIEIYYMNNYC